MEKTEKTEKISLDEIQEVSISENETLSLRGEYKDEAWDKKSMVVVACNGWDGVILFAVGPHIMRELDAMGKFASLEDVSLDYAPHGISVWEGVYQQNFVTGLDGTEVDGSESIGDFRQLTTDEWEAVMKNECPWNEEEIYGFKEGIGNPTITTPFTSDGNPYPGMAIENPNVREGD